MAVENLYEYSGNLLGEYVDESYREEEIQVPGHHWAARPLLQAIQDDWGVFSATVLANENSRNLVDDLLCSSKNSHGDTLKRNTWVLRFSRQARRVEWRVWEKMFPTNTTASQSVDDVREAMDILGTGENQVGDQLSYFAFLIERGSALYRARPGCQTKGGVRTPHQDVGPNPVHPASRANTDGQYSVYMAEVEMTSVAEIRQPPGSAVSVGEFIVGRDLTVIDLCHSSETPNPFVTKNLSLQLDIALLLSTVAATMSKPAQTPDDYCSTQLLANIVRALGYDGIRYPSAVHSGSPNVVVFTSDAVSKRASWVSILTASAVDWS